MSLGIDAGSRTFRAACKKGGGVDLLPGSTTPAIFAQGAEMVLAGKEATKELDTKHNNILKYPTAELRRAKKFKLKHPKATKDVSPEHALGALFSIMDGKAKKHYKDHTASIQNVYVSVPTALTSIERQQLLVATNGGGFPSAKLIDSSVAAAIRWGTMKKAGFSQTILVIDVGARFSSASVVKVLNTDRMITVTVLSSRSWRYGGLDVDKRLQSLAPTTSAATPASVIATAVENAKKELSSLADALIKVKDGTRIINRTHLAAAAYPLLHRITLASRELIDACPPNLVTNALLIGGSSRLLALQMYVSKQLHLKIEHEDFDYLAVLGAAYAATGQKIVSLSPLNCIASHQYYIVQAAMGEEGFPTPTGPGFCKIFENNLTTHQCIKSEADSNGNPDANHFLIYQRNAHHGNDLTLQGLLSVLERSVVNEKSSQSSSVEKTLRRKSESGELGLNFVEWDDWGPSSQGSLELSYVTPGSDADNSGFHSAVGWRLSSINGSSITCRADVAKFLSERKMVFKFYKDSLPPSSGDNQNEDITLIGYVDDGSRIKVNENGIIAAVPQQGTFYQPRQVITAFEIQDDLEDDSELQQTVRVLGESRNNLEEAVLSGEVDDLKHEHRRYIEAAEEWLDQRADFVPTVHQLDALASLIYTIYCGKDKDIEANEAKVSSLLPDIFPPGLKRRLSSRRSPSGRSLRTVSSSPRMSPLRRASLPRGMSPRRQRISSSPAISSPLTGPYPSPKGRSSSTGSPLISPAARCSSSPVLRYNSPSRRTSSSTDRIPLANGMAPLPPRRRTSSPSLPPAPASPPISSQRRSSNQSPRGASPILVGHPSPQARRTSLSGAMPVPLSGSPIGNSVPFQSSPVEKKQPENSSPPAAAIGSPLLLPEAGPQLGNNSFPNSEVSDILGSIPYAACHKTRSVVNHSSPPVVAHAGITSVKTYAPQRIVSQPQRQRRGSLSLGSSATPLRNGTPMRAQTSVHKTPRRAKWFEVSSPEPVRRHGSPPQLRKRTCKMFSSIEVVSNVSQTQRWPGREFERERYTSPRRAATPNKRLASSSPSINRRRRAPSTGNTTRSAPPSHPVKSTRSASRRKDRPPQKVGQRVLVF